jgi:hypothetical protein
MNTLSPEQQLLIAGLPGADLVANGLADAAAGRVTRDACLVSIAGPRLRSAKLLSESHATIPEAELTLYDLLCEQTGDAYSTYNSLLRRLVSFERALDHRLTARAKPASSGPNLERGC